MTSCRSETLGAGLSSGPRSSIGSVVHLALWIHQHPTPTISLHVLRFLRPVCHPAFGYHRKDAQSVPTFAANGQPPANEGVRGYLEGAEDFWGVAECDHQLLRRPLSHWGGGSATGCLLGDYRKKLSGKAERTVQFATHVAFCNGEGRGNFVDEAARSGRGIGAARPAVAWWPRWTLHTA